MTAVESAYLAQLLDQRASEVRRLAVPSEALTDERRDIYRAIVTSALDTDVVSPERVIAELREMGRLERVGGDRGIHLLSEQTGMVPADGARAELLAAASARVIARTGMMLGSLAGAGQSREAADVMRSATSLLASFAGDKATPLKSMRDHISEWTRRATDPERRAPRIQLGALEDDVGDYAPGNMGLIDLRLLAHRQVAPDAVHGAPLRRAGIPHAAGVVRRPGPPERRAPGVRGGEP